MKKNNFTLGLTLGLVLIMSIGSGDTQAQFWKKKKKTAKTEVKDTTAKKTEDAYEKLIKDAQVAKGMFNIIKKKDKVYLEIPKNIMHRDYLLCSRVSSTSETWQIDPGTINRTPLLISWSADKERVYIHLTPTLFQCDTTSEMYSPFCGATRLPLEIFQDRNPTQGFQQLRDRRHFSILVIH